MGFNSGFKGLNRSKTKRTHHSFLETFYLEFCEMLKFDFDEVLGHTGYLLKTWRQGECVWHWKFSTGRIQLKRVHLYAASRHSERIGGVSMRHTQSRIINMAKVIMHMAAPRFW